MGEWERVCASERGRASEEGEHRHRSAEVCASCKRLTALASLASLPTPSPYQPQPIHHPATAWTRQALSFPPHPQHPPSHPTMTVEIPHKDAPFIVFSDFDGQSVWFGSAPRDERWTTNDHKSFSLGGDVSCGQQTVTDLPPSTLALFCRTAQQAPSLPRCVSSPSAALPLSLCCPFPPILVDVTLSVFLSTFLLFRAESS